LLAAACAGSAPELPPDTTSLNRTRSLDLSNFSASDAAMSCNDIANERERNSTAIKDANARIAGDRVRDQVAAYIVPLTGAVFAGAHDEEHAGITRLYARQDVLIQLGNVKKCGGPPPAAK
jgi:hypothetical protein